MQRLAVAVEGLRTAGHTLEVVTTGGTGTAEFRARHQAVTEVQPGSFIFMDADYLDTRRRSLSAGAHGSRDRVQPGVRTARWSPQG